MPYRKSLISRLTWDEWLPSRRNRSGRSWWWIPTNRSVSYFARPFRICSHTRVLWGLRPPRKVCDCLPGNPHERGSLTTHRIPLTLSWWKNASSCRTTVAVVVGTIPAGHNTKPSHHRLLGLSTCHPALIPTNKLPSHSSTFLVTVATCLPVHPCLARHCFGRFVPMRTGPVETGLCSLAFPTTWTGIGPTWNGEEQTWSGPSHHRP